MLERTYSANYTELQAHEGTGGSRQKEGPVFNGGHNWTSNIT